MIRHFWRFPWQHGNSHQLDTEVIETLQIKKEKQFVIFHSRADVQSSSLKMKVKGYRSRSHPCEEVADPLGHNEYNEYGQTKRDVTSTLNKYHRYADGHSNDTSQLTRGANDCVLAYVSLILNTKLMTHIYERCFHTLVNCAQQMTFTVYYELFLSVQDLISNRNNH